MKKVLLTIFLLIVFTIAIHAQQRTVAECTINYAINLISADDSDLHETLKLSSETVYIKANNVRIDLVSPAFKQTTFFDKSLKEAVVLREFGNNKFINRLNTKEWVEANKKFDSLELKFQSETKNILGYECKKVEINTGNKNLYTVFYVPSIIPSVKEYEYVFKDVPGLILAFQTTDNKLNTIQYVATKINFNPIPIHVFDVPTEGYRLIPN